MDNLISRQAALDALGEAPEVWTDSPEEFAALSQWEMDVTAIKALPSAEPERKTGKWITDTYGHIICSECGWCAPRIMTGCLCDRHLDYVKSEFCWCCGADMRGGNDETIAD